MKNETYPMKKSGSTLVEEIIYRYVPYWPLFLLLSILFLVLSSLYLTRTPPTYEATASILLSDQLKGSDQNQVSEALSLPTDKNIVENELEVLHSRSIMDQIVNDLKLYAPIYRKGYLNDSITSYSECPVNIEVQHSENIKLFRKLSFSYNQSKGTVLFNNSSYPLNHFINTPYGIMKFNYDSNKVGDSRREYMFDLIPIKTVTEHFLKLLETTPSVKGSTIVRLRLLDQDPKKAEDILNNLLYKYTQSSVIYKNQLAKNTIAFIDDRLNILANNLDSVEQQVQQYKASHNITNLDDQGKLYLQNVSVNDQRLTDINIQLAALNQVQQYVNTKDNAQIIAPSSLGVNDPTLTKLLDRLAEQQMQYEKLKRTTGANNPILQTVQKEIDDLRPSIAENIQNQRRALQVGRSSISSTNSGYNSVLQSIPKKEKGLIDITRDQSVKNVTYSYLLQKREQAALAYSSTVPDSRIIDRAQSSPTPVAPKRSIVYLIAITIAAITTIAFILLKETFTNKVLFRNEIEESTNYPVMGEISQFGKENKTLTSEADKVLLNKQLSKLFSSSNLYLPANTPYKILVTSEKRSEGKSFITSNMARLLSESGKKVLLIDADFENPSLTKFYSSISEPGFFNIINENGGFLSKNVKSLYNKNLYFLPAGTTSNGLPLALANNNLTSFMNELSTQFDILIFDCSSLNDNANTNILSNLVDITFFVIRHGVTTKDTIYKLDKDYSISNLRNVALIFNGLKKRGFFFPSRYGYGYN